jgi:hypothetical protein
MLGLLARRTDVKERRAASGVVELLLTRRGGPTPPAVTT